MVVDVKEESCLHTEGHSRILRVSAWRVWERANRSEFDLRELESEKEGLRALGDRIGGFMKEVGRLVISCIGGFKRGSELTR